MRLAALVLATTALVPPALAQPRPAPPDPNVPRAELQDPHMRVQDYRPGVRTRFVGSLTRQTVLTFGDGEEVVRISFGDNGDTWDVPDQKEVNGDPQNNQKAVPLLNVLPLYPRKVGYTSLLVVTQRKDGSYRPYQFAAEVRDLPDECAGKATACDDPDATYGLFFRYPEDEAKARREEYRSGAPQRLAAAQQAQHVAMRDRLTVDAISEAGCVDQSRPHPLGLYEAEGNEAGKASLVPDDVRDNGRETVFRFAGDRSMPTFYLLNPDGTLRTVLPYPRGHEYAVLPGTYKEIRLILGGAVLHVYNRTFNAEGCPTGTYTTRPDVVRRVRQARAPE